MYMDHQKSKEVNACESTRYHIIIKKVDANHRTPSVTFPVVSISTSAFVEFKVFFHLSILREVLLVLLQIIPPQKQKKEGCCWGKMKRGMFRRSSINLVNKLRKTLLSCTFLLHLHQG